MITPKTNWNKEWSVEIRVRVDRQGKTVLDERSAALLAALDQSESITASAHTTGVSYRHAWLIINDANAAAGEPLTETSVGGRGGGGARLTARGRAALKVFDRLRTSLMLAAATALPKALAEIGHDSPVLHLFAAISLQEVVVQLLAEYALLRPATKVRAVFGGSNELAEQALLGGAADVFISANTEQVDRLAKNRKVHSGSRTILATNGLAVAASKEFRGTVREPSDLLKSGIDRIVIADPECPLGQYTVKFLKSVGVYEQLRPRLAQVDNSRAVVSTIRGSRSKSTLGLIFSSDIANFHGLRTLFRPPAQKLGVAYEGAVLAGSTYPAESADLLAFLASETAKTCFRRCGFITPSR